MELGKAYVRIEADATKLTTGLNKAQKNVAASMKTIGRNMAIAGAAIVAGFGIAIKTASQFEQSMANTASVAGATAEELKNLSDFARKMGEQSIFSASQAADGMYFLASAGMNVEEVMSSLKGTLDLAAATASDLAFVSETTAATLSQFGLDASEAERVANVFAATISMSQATMEKLSTSMSYVGPIAKSMGMTLEDTVGILGNLFNAGFDASMAGTSLRMAFTMLIEPTKKGQKALDNIGISVRNSAGEMRPFADIIDELAVKGLSTADAMNLFGKRAGPAMLALVSQGEGAIRELTDAVTGTNKATEMAEMQIDTFQGAMKLLRSAFEELQITLVQDLMPSLKGMIEQVTEGIKKVSDWMKENPKLTETIVKWSAAIGALMLVLGPLLIILPGLAVGVGALLSPIGLVVLAIIGAIATYITWFKVIQEIDKILHSHRTTIEDVEAAENLLSETQKETAKKLGLTIEKYREYLELGWSVTEMIEGMTKEMEENIEKTKNTAAVQNFYNLAIAKLKEEAEKGTISVKVLYEEMKKLDEILEKGTIAFDEQIQTLTDTQKAYDVLQNFLGPIRDTIVELTKELTPYEQKIADVNAKYDDMIEAIKMFNVSEEIQKEKIDEVNKARDLAITKLEEEKIALEKLEEAKQKLIDATETMIDRIFELTHTARELAIKKLDEERQAYLDLGKSQEEVIKWYQLEMKALDKLYPKKKKDVDITKKMGKETDKTGETFKEIAKTAEKTFERVTVSVYKAGEALSDFTVKGIAAAITSIKMRYIPMIEKLREEMQELFFPSPWYEYKIEDLTKRMNEAIAQVMYGYKEYQNILASLGAGDGGGGWAGYQQGTPYVPETGLAMVHKGEEINPPGQRSYDYRKSYASSINIQPGAIIINTPRFSGRDAKEMLAKIKREAAMQGYKFATA